MYGILFVLLGMNYPFRNLKNKTFLYSYQLLYTLSKFFILFWIVSFLDCLCILLYTERMYNYVNIMYIKYMLESKIFSNGQKVYQVIYDRHFMLN